MWFFFFFFEKWREKNQKKKSLKQTKLFHRLLFNLFSIKFTTTTTKLQLLITISSLAPKDN